MHVSFLKLPVGISKTGPVAKMTTGLTMVLLELHICYSNFAKASYSFIFSAEGGKAHPSPLSHFIMSVGPADKGNLLRKASFFAFRKVLKGVFIQRRPRNP